MLLLTSTGDIIRVITGSASDIEAHASYVDNNAGVITPGRTNTPSITTAVTTTVVGSPGSGIQRNVKLLSLYNNHATVSTTIAVEHSDGTNIEAIWEGLLLPGESVTLDAVGCWTLYNVEGIPKAPQAKLDVYLRVTADVINATTSFADVTGLTYTVKSGKKYGFNAHLISISNLTTTGHQYGVNGPTATNYIIASIGVTLNHATTPTFGAGSATAVNTAAVVETTGSATNALHIMSGSFDPTADGTFAIRCASEVAVAAGLTVKKGSWCHLFETDN